MSLTQIPEANPDEFSRCEERKQISESDHGKTLSPDQRSDAAIKEAIYRAFWKDNFLRTIEYYEVDVHVKNGFVHLYGHIVSVTSHNLIENITQAIPGVLGIKNNLVLDDKLTLEVASSLGELEHVYGCKFFTGASHGVISLNGTVNDENVKLLAEQCAADNPDVRGVINNIQILNARVGLLEQQFLQPTIGENIYFLDGIYGVVRQVVINPNNRRVIAMIIEGRFMDQLKQLDPIHVNQTSSQEQTLVIPMSTVRYLTRASGFLDIHSSEKNRYMEFDAVHFSNPKPDWKTPYPYCPEDVLFLATQQQQQNIENQVLQQLYSPYAAILTDSVLKEQLLANDSLGG